MISPELQAELRAKFNPDGSDLRNLQLRMLEMLKYIDLICRENDIKYWLSSGTCLGAVRHGGFIPWDDDVDIEMLEEDYNKLEKILLQINKENPKYVFQSQKNDSNYINDFGKLRNPNISISEVSGIDKSFKYRGLFIDLFCIAPSNSYKLSYFCGCLRVLEVSVYKWAQKNGSFAKFLRQLFHNFNTVIIRCLKPISRIGANGQLRHSLGSAFYKPRFYEDIFPLTVLPFEDTSFPVPRDYDKYLRKIYGDYTTLQISSQHINKA